jgi:hypothetical protein
MFGVAINGITFIPSFMNWPAGSEVERGGMQTVWLACKPALVPVPLAHCVLTRLVWCL